MKQAIIITPVKNSLQSALKTIDAIKNSEIDIEHIVYNDFSNVETSQYLEKNASKKGFKLINLEELTNTPSPNYGLVLKEAQKLALKNNIPLIIVESDVVVKPHTFSEMLNFNNENKNAGLIGAITVDNFGKINFPYKKFKKRAESSISTTRSLSFCCTLLSVDFLKTFNFDLLDKSKSWYDTSISKKSIELGFDNFMLLDNKVVHMPHSSRPWKQLKYKNPIKYYYLKIIHQRDTI